MTSSDKSPASVREALIAQLRVAATEYCIALVESARDLDGLKLKADLRKRVGDLIDALSAAPAVQPAAQEELVRAARNVLAAVDHNLDAKNPPGKYTVPWAEMTALRAALKEQVQPPAATQEELKSLVDRVIEGERELDGRDPQTLCFLMAEHWKSVAAEHKAKAADYDRLKQLYSLLKAEMDIDHGQSVLADAARWRLLQEELKSTPSPAAPTAPVTMDDAMAAGDGTLHGAIGHWQGRALKAEAALKAQTAPTTVEDEREAFEKWLLTVSHPTGSERLSASSAIEFARAAWIARAAAVKAPEGYVLVPIEPTPAMLSAVDDEAEDKHIARGRAYSAWKSMVAAAPAQSQKETVPPSIWYMRDNHTFLRLPLDVEQALAKIAEEFKTGDSWGTLCGHRNDERIGDVVHARGRSDWARFEVDARAWLEAVLAAAPAQGKAGV